MTKYLLIILLFAVSAYPADTKDYLYIGYDGMDGSGGYPCNDSIRSLFVTCTDDGTVDSIVAEVLNTMTAADFKCAVYEYSPTNCIGSTQVVEVGSDFSSQVIAFPAFGTITLDSNAYYYIAIWAEDVAGIQRIYYTADAGSYNYRNYTDYGAWPDPITFYTYTNNVALNLYMKVDTATAATGPPDHIHGPDGAGVLHGPGGGSKRHGP